MSRRRFLTALPGCAAAPLLTRPSCPAAAVHAQPQVSPSVPRPLLSGDYRLVFGDEFSDERVARINEDASGAVAPTWRSRYRHPRRDIINGEKQLYVDPAWPGNGEQPLGLQPFGIRSGLLTIEARRADPALAETHLGGQRFTSGCLTSELTHWQTYGFFEMRARLPVGRGFWPAFWLLPKRDAWPPEIDVFEASGARPDEVHVNVLDRRPGRPDHGGWFHLPAGRPDGFRVFAAEWTAERIAFFVDGRMVHAVAGHRIHEDMYLLANLAVGSNDQRWIPDPDASTPFPGRFEIDYIRAFQRT